LLAEDVIFVPDVVPFNTKGWCQNMTREVDVQVSIRKYASFCGDISAFS
jgi:hypothetical protein